MRIHKYLKAGSDRLREAILRIRSVAASFQTRSNENKTVVFVVSNHIVNDFKRCFDCIGLACILALVCLV